MKAITYVCPSKDIVCGDRPANWCATCPLHARRPAAEGVTDAQIMAATEAALVAVAAQLNDQGLEDISPDDVNETSMQFKREFIRALLALQPSPAVQQPVAQAEGKGDAWLDKAEELFDAAMLAARLDGHPMSGIIESHRVSSARDALLAHLAARVSATPQADPKSITTALNNPACERLKEWAAIGPVQRAAVEDFADLIAGGEPPSNNQQEQPK